MKGEMFDYHINMWMWIVFDRDLYVALIGPLYLINRLNNSCRLEKKLPDVWKNLKKYL